MKLVSKAMDLVAKASLPVYFLVTLTVSFAILAVTLPFDGKFFQVSVALTALFLVAAIVYKTLADNAKGDEP
ncbi:MAG TPA: hypothetical protein VMV71_00395 [Candidatus Paceibacterota bacterium]|nr:hypothetical protein [Candidatus Paceibacterota bacterium]